MKMTDQEVVDPVDGFQVQLNEKPIVTIKKKYKEKKDRTVHSMLRRA